MSEQTPAILATVAMVLALSGCWGGSDDLPPPSPSPVVVRPSLPTRSAIIHMVDGVLDASGDECAQRAQPSATLPAVVGCLVHGGFLGRRNHAGWVYLAYAYPPDDLTLDRFAEPGSSWVRWPGPIPGGERLGPCRPWKSLAVPSVAQAVGCGIRGRYRAEERAVLASDKVLVLVAAMAEYDPVGCDVLAEPYRCGEADSAYLEKLTLDLAERMLAAVP